MPHLKDIRKRIGSVKNTKKITRAMKMVAAAKLRRAQEAVIMLRPYAQTIERVSLFLLDNVERGDEPLMRQPEEKKKVCAVVISSNRGLCGAYNTNVNRAAHSLWQSRKDDTESFEFIVIGRKSNDFLSRRDAPISNYVSDAWSRPAREVASEVMSDLIKRFKEDELDEVIVISTDFRSAIVQNVETRSLLPLRGVVEAEVGEDATAERTAMKRVEMPDINEYIYEPSEEAVLQTLLPMYLTTQLQRALLESAASEQGSRMSAMDSATNNADEMISSLTLQYNRARQAAITRELIEIISGADAL